MKRPFSVLAVFFCLAALSGRAFGGEAEDFFRQGKYTEAREAYSALEMEHPKDVRYRYNRGVAAYKAGDPESAAAAFASVLKRGGKEDILFRSDFNLGVTAYEGRDYETAARHFLRALAKDPEDADARLNLQLSLWQRERMEQQKKEEEEGGSCENPSDKEGEDGREGDKEGKGGQNGKDGQGDEEKGRRQEGEGERRTGENQGEKAKNPDGRSAASEKEEQPRDLNGELSAMEDLGQPGKKEDGAPREEAAAAMERRKAQALLDNVEDHLIPNLSGRPSGGDQAGGSGKNW